MATIKDSIFIKQFKISLRDERHGTIFVQTIESGDEWVFAKDICFAKGISSSDLDELAKSILKKNGWVVNSNLKSQNLKVEEKIASKKPSDSVVDYASAVVDKPMVFLANAKKITTEKVILKPRKREYNEITVYAIKEKASGKFIHELSDKGYRVSNSQPLFFTSEDIACIGNTEDFEIIKMKRKCKAINNKIAK